MEDGITRCICCKQISSDRDNPMQDYSMTKMGGLKEHTSKEGSLRQRVRFHVLVQFIHGSSSINQICKIGLLMRKIMIF
jgi:hypothetical protein